MGVEQVFPAVNMGILIEVLKIVVIILGAVLADYLISRYIKKIAKLLSVSIETLKGLRFFFRFIILAFVLISLASVRWLPSEYFFSAGAITATIVGFASATIVSNFLSGAYVLISRVIRIGDYVRIGNIEGLVVDLSVNFTKIELPNGTVVILSNKDISSKTIISFSREIDGTRYFVYPIEFSISTKMPYETIKSLFEEIRQKLQRGVEIESLEVIGVSTSELKYRVTIKTEDSKLIIPTKHMILEQIAEFLTKSE